MRIDPAGTQLTARFREPRIVIGIIYETLSIYLTSRTGIANVPGNVIYGCLQDVSSTSQQLFPDEGRATIGSMTFTAVDLAGDITDAIREQLLSLDRGIRNTEVRVFTGDGDDFNQYVRVETYVVDEAVELDQGLYSFSCSDRNRELREEIFQQIGTRLTTTLETVDTVVNVQQTGGFTAVQHTAAFEDAPGAKVGYIRVRKTGEIIRWTGKTPTSFTGCTRERFRTIADKVAIDPGTAPDKLPEIEEFIYLQMPGPQLAYAVMTGKILGTTDTLPETWNLGIDAANVDATAFTNIGADLYDPANPAGGMVLSFPYLQQTDGKRFIEEQINRVILTYSPVDTRGRLSLRRMAALLSAASPAAKIGYAEIISHGPIRHMQASVINEVEFDWNYDGEVYTRTDVLFNANSITTFGRSTRVKMELGGLNASQHGRASLQHIFDSYTDRYGAPPIVVQIQVSAAFNHLEIGDCVLVELPLLPDFSGVGTLSRVFEIQSRAINWATGDLTFDLFASTSRVDPDNHGGTAPYLPDAWYTSEGTPLSSVLTMTGDHVVASGALTGNADLRLAVYYHDGDVIIDSGVTVTISHNVQIRCTGELQVVGKINGAGQGIPAPADPNVVGAVYVSAVGGPVQTLGSSQGSAGIWHSGSEFLEFGSVTYFGPAAIARAALRVAGTTLVGIPAELRGTPGVPAVGVLDTGSLTVRALGGIGGAGGAGLMIASRGLSFGVAGQIDLSGQSGGSAISGPITIAGVQLIGGAGGGGCAGTLLVVLDGDQITFPDLEGTFVANHGATPQSGTPIARAPPDSGTQPWTGRSPGLGFVDNAAACSIVQYLMLDTEYGETDDEVLPAPTDLAAVGDGNGLTLSWKPPAADRYDYVEIWEAISNDRTGSLRIAQVRGDHLAKTSGASITRYYWARSVRAAFGHSEWDPVDPLDGVSATFGGATGSDTVLYYIKPTDGTALHNSASTLTVEAHKLTGGVDILLSTGTIKLYVGGTEVSVANGYGVGSDGYTGVFDSGDIGGDVVVELKDGPGGTVLDTITLVDILDGAAASSAAIGYVETTGPIAWTRASDQVTWTPSATTVDLCATFRKAGSDVARIARRITRDSAGILTASTVAHPGGDLNTGTVTVTILGASSQSLTVKFDYDNGSGDKASVAEGVLTSMAGIDGTDGFPGADSGGLLSNSGFEVGALLPGWSTTGAQATVINDITKAHAGTWSVHISTGSTGVRTSPIYRPSVVVGQVMVANCYAARDGSSLPDADGALSIQWEDSSGTVIATSASALADHAVSGYQVLKVEAQAPAGATHAVVQFKKSGGSTGLWYADDFSLTTKGDAGTDGPELVLTSGLTRAGRTITKTGATSAWDQSARSTQGFDSCRVAWTVGQTNKAVMLGLTTDPTANDSYDTIDFAFYAPNDGVVQIYENGVQTVLGIAYTTATQFEITYDGQTVRYVLDGVVVLSRTVAGAKLYMDSSFYYPSTQINQLVFVPGIANLAVSDEVRDDFAYLSSADFLRNYLDLSGAGEISFVTGISDAPAGTAIRIGNNSGNDQRWEEMNRLMPYDGVSLYEVGVIARRNAGAGALYSGLVGVAADGVTRISTTGANTFGSQHYLAAEGATPGSSWVVYRGYAKGWSATAGSLHNDAASPGKMYTGVAYVRPMFLVNYSGASGQMDIAALWVRRLNGALNAKDSVSTTTIDVAAATEVYVAYTATPGGVAQVGGYDYYKFFVEQNSSRTYGNKQQVPAALQPYAMNDVIALAAGFTVKIGLAAHWSGGFTDILTISAIPAPIDANQSMVFNAAGANLYELSPDGGITYAITGVDLTMQGVKVKR